MHHATTHHPGRAILLVTVALMVLLAVTTGVSFLHLGPLGLAFALLIALTKVTIVGLWFMNLKRAAPTVRLFAAASLGWVVVLFAGVLADYLSRGL